MELSVNIDHIATLRQARQEKFPDPAHAAVEAELAGCDGITVHLRHDRRHIQVQDVKILRHIIKTELNVEMAATRETEKIMTEIKPHRITLVPESPGEITTQGGLNVIAVRADLTNFIRRLKNAGIRVGIFIDPESDQIKGAIKLGAQYVELNTAKYCRENRAIEINRLRRAARFARREGLLVHAGHGLDYHNIQALLSIPEITGYSIGFAIIARAVFVGLRQAVKDMKDIIKGAP